jgi:hypothetical protein
MRLVRIAAPLIAALGLSACATLDGPQTSYVAPLQSPKADAYTLAGGICNFLTDDANLSPMNTTIAVAGAGKGDELAPTLADELRQSGFAVVSPGQPVPAGAKRLRYVVTPLLGGELLRVDIEAGGITRASRYYLRDSAGYLQAGGPFTVQIHPGKKVADR